MVRGARAMRDYTSAMDRPWYESAFCGPYLQVYAHRSPQQAEAQVRAMLACGLLPSTGRVLDIACGAGRHLHAMRRVGLDARGLDYSQDLLRAGSLAGLAVRADMRVLPFADAAFDWACSLFTSFGYFESAAQDQRMFAQAARVLRPGGSLVLDHINPVVTLRELKAHTVDETAGRRLVQSRRYDSTAGLLVKDVEFTYEGKTQCWQERVRLYEPTELQDLLRGAGFARFARYGDLDGRPWLPEESPRQVVRAML